MATTTKLSRAAAFILALVMIFSIVPMQIFAAAPVAATDLQLKDSVTVAISKDMTDDQIKKALFEQLVTNPEGASYKDYDWEYYAPVHTADPFPKVKYLWSDVLLGNKEPDYMLYHYDYYPIKQEADASYQIRLKGTDKAVKITKVSTADVAYHWDSFMGTVNVNGKTAVNGKVNPANDVVLDIVPNEGYKIASVKMNGTELAGEKTIYSFTPVASTKIEVTFAEDGVFHNVALNIGKGASVTVNGVSKANGETIRVKEGVDYTFVVTPDASTSVKAVAVNGQDMTSDVKFAKYVGTFTKTFTADDSIEFVTVDVKDTLVLNNKLEAGFAVNAQGKPDWKAIHENYVNGFVDNSKSALKMTASNTEIQEWKQLRLAGGGNGAWAWVKLEGEQKEMGTYFEASKSGDNLKFHIRFLGNEQFRPTEFIEFHGNVKDVQKANIALKSNPVVEIVETAVGVYDYTNLNEKVFNAAIDASASMPANITLKDIVLTVPQNITKTGSYKVKASIAGTTSYYAASVEFDVQFNIVKRPTANIVLIADTVNVELNETKVGVYDNAKLRENAKAAAINRAACEANGLDYDKITIEMADVKADGTYKATLSYPTTDMIYGASKDVNVVVKVNKAPKAHFEAKNNQTATLFKNFDGSFDYAELKNQIFNLITVTGVEGIKAENCRFEYYLTTNGAVFIGQDKFYDFSVTSVKDDITNQGHYLYQGGSFTIKVTLPSSESYYGTAIDIKVNVAVKDNHTADVVLNEGAPYKVVLNKNKNGTFNYDELKASVFAAAVKEIKNVPGTVRYTDVNFQYKPWGAKEFHNFEEEIINGDNEHIIYTRLCDSKNQDFDVTLNVPSGHDYHGTTVAFKINVEVKDPHKAAIAINETVAPVTLKETTVGRFDYDTLKKDIYAAAVNAAASTPSTVKFEDFTIVVPEITKSGDYTVTLKYLGDYNYNGYDISILVHVDVKYLPTAKIVLKSNHINLTIRETQTGMYDVEALKAEILAQIDTEKSFPALTAKDVTVTFDRDVDKTGKYIATIKYAGTDKIHGTEAKVDADVTLVSLPKVELAFKNADLTLNKLQDGSWGYEDLKKAIFENCIKVTGVEGLSYDKFVYEYKPWGLNMGWTAFDTQDVTLAEKYLRDGGEFDFRVSIPTSSTYYGASVEFKLTIKTADPYKHDIVLKQDYQNFYELSYNNMGEYNYEKLEKAIFDAIVDTTKSPAHMTYENATVAYKPHTRGIDGATIDSVDFHPINTTALPEDNKATFLYLRDGGTFTFKISFEATEDCRAAEAIVKLTINPEKRNYSAIVLKNVDIEYIPDFAAIEQIILDNVDIEASKLPADITRDNLIVEYYRDVTLAGGGSGAWFWTSIAGENKEAGSYFKHIEVGTWKIRVRFTGNENYLPCTSNEAKINVRYNDLKVEITNDSKFIDTKIPADLIKLSMEDDFNEYYIFTRLDKDTAVISIDDKNGMVKDDFTAYIAFNQLLLDILGIDNILSAEEIYTNRGLTREQLISVLSDSRFVKFVSTRHDIDEAACAKLLEAANSLPENIKHFRFNMGQPEQGGKYQFIVMAGKANYKTAFAVKEPFFIKYHSRGAKLKWVQEIDRLNSITAKFFDFDAVLTRDGIPSEGKIKYIYTGFRANGMFYGSTKNPPREPGIYTQTAWTAIGTKYAFPKTRTFVIHVL